MKIELKIPSMGESITQVTIGAIFKPSGSEVKLDEELMEFETDKLTQVLYAPEAGQVSYSVKTGDVLAVGQTFGFITVGLVDVKKEETLPAVKEEIVELKEEAPVVIETVAAQDTRPETRKRLSSLRKTLAERLVEAQKASLPLTTFNEVDMTQVMACREKYKEFFVTKHGVKLGLMSFFVKAVVSALQAFPVLNSYLDGDDLVYRNYFDIGVAVSTEKGVIVPVLKNSDVLSFADIEKQIADSAVRAKSGKLSLEELQGGGFTITNGGVFGSLLSTPMINPPQCAILGMHKITKRAVVVDDQIVIRPMMYLALSYDHRLLDGKEAVSFLIHVKNCIEDPLRLELGV